MWIYSQSSGHLFNDTINNSSAHCYSGKGECKNDPDSQDKVNEGPIPRGNYTILEPYDTKVHGPYVMHLVPDTINEMFGREGFLIHGDSVVEPGTASEGCIITSRKNREIIWNSKDHALKVIE